MRLLLFDLLDLSRLNMSENQTTTASSRSRHASCDRSVTSLNGHVTNSHDDVIMRQHLSPRRASRCCRSNYPHSKLKTRSATPTRNGDSDVTRTEAPVARCASCNKVLNRSKHLQASNDDATSAEVHNRLKHASKNQENLNSNEATELSSASSRVTSSRLEVFNIDGDRQRYVLTKHLPSSDAPFALTSGPRSTTNATSQSCELRQSDVSSAASSSTSSVPNSTAQLLDADDVTSCPDSSVVVTSSPAKRSKLFASPIQFIKSSPLFKRKRKPSSNHSAHAYSLQNLDDSDDVSETSETTGASDKLQQSASLPGSPFMTRHNNNMQVRP